MKDVSIGPASRKDLPQVMELLEDGGLPPDGLEEHLTTILVARLQGRAVGSAALELYGTAALLRSVAVRRDLRDTGLGTRLTEAALRLSTELGAAEAHLFTETGDHFFPRFGFRNIPRSRVPSSVRTSSSSPPPAPRAPAPWHSICEPAEDRTRQTPRAVIIVPVRENAPSSPHASDLRLMRRALQAAEEAAERGEVPVGAVVARGEEVLAVAANQREATKDPTAHAELLAIRRAASALGGWRLTGCTLYATLEPCPMCAGAAHAARIDRLVYAAPDPKAGYAGTLHDTPADARLNHTVAVEKGLLEAEAAEMLRSFFENRRRHPGIGIPKPDPGQA